MTRVIFTAILIFAFCLAAFAQTSRNVCPKISFVLPNQMLFPDEPITFSARVGENMKKQNLSYEWAFSTGKILKGQGTSQVEFLATEEDEAANVNISVKVFGLPKDCSNTYSDIFGIASLPIGKPFEKLGKPNKKRLREYFVRIDGFMIPVEDYPKSEGLITITFEKNDNRNYKISLLKKIFNVFVFRKFDLTRITFAISENDYPEETVLWVVPPDAKFPKYVDKNYAIIKAEEFEQRIKELFPKK